MSLPAHLFLYDVNGRLISGSSDGVLSELLEGRQGAIEVMNSSHKMYVHVDTSTGSLTGCRQHGAYTIYKQVDKVSPLLNDALCTGKKFQQAVIKYYEITEVGAEKEIYRVTMNNVVIASIDFSHAYTGGSRNNNMQEIVALRYSEIEWFYLPGMIKYSDSWDRNLNSDNKSESSTQR